MSWQDLGRHCGVCRFHWCLSLVLVRMAVPVAMFVVMVVVMAVRLGYDRSGSVAPSLSSSSGLLCLTFCQGGGSVILLGARGDGQVY